MQSSNFLSRCVLGTAGLGGIWGKVNPEESIMTILASLECGVKAIDTAPAYGDGESFVGKALGQWKGSMPQVSTKAGRLKSYAADVGCYDYSSEGLEKSIHNSLKTLEISIIDILFLHDPSAISPEQAERVAEELSEFKRKGYAKKIGLGGNSPEWFNKYITPDVFDVVMEYNRLNACCVEALNSSLPGYQSKGIEFYVASPLHMGILGNRFDMLTENPPAWLDKNNINRAKKVKKIADKHGMQLSSLAHRFLLTIPGNFKIVIGPSNLRELQDTLADFEAGPLAKDIYDEIINNIDE